MSLSVEPKLFWGSNEFIGGAKSFLGAQMSLSVEPELFWGSNEFIGGAKSFFLGCKKEVRTEKQCCVQNVGLCEN
jgi:hypothetical protein